MIAKFQHNICVANVFTSTQQRKRRANAVVFSQPVYKLYTVLPPPEELEGGTLLHIVA